MSEFKLPDNVKQIGSIDEGLTIYMEDYVCTYLKQYADSGGHCEKIAFLVGKYMTIDSKPYVFISGAIQGRYSEYEDGMEVFTDSSYQYAAEMLDSYFEGYEIIGWMQSQPGYGTYLNPACADYHMNNFPHPHQVFFVSDPVERISAFYSWNKDASGIEEASGYFVYFDQNEGMQNYMLDHKITTTKNVSTAVQFEPQSADIDASNIVNTAPDLISIGKSLASSTRRSSKSTKRNERSPAKSHPAVTPSRSRKDKSKPTARAEATPHPASPGNEYKRVLNMLVSLSAVLFVICFIMGAGLIQSDSRIGELETEASTMKTNYAYLENQVKQLGSYPVFQQSDSAVDEADSAVANTESDSQDIVNSNESSVLTEADISTDNSEAVSVDNNVDETVSNNSSENVSAENAVDENLNAGAENATDESLSASTDIPESYTVAEGDTLYSISRKFYGNIEMVGNILELNNIEDAELIRIGDVLLLPR